MKTFLERDSASSSFAEALRFTLQWEGGYVNHPMDKGGPTNKGVTQIIYDAFRRQKNIPTQSVRRIFENEVGEIYKEMYWNTVRAELCQTKIAVALFDWAVNTGPVRAIRHLQGCLSVAQDGIIGPVTRERMAVAGDDVLDCFLKRREIFYKSQPKKKKDVFLKGWMNRLEALGEYLSEL